MGEADDGQTELEDDVLGRGGRRNTMKGNYYNPLDHLNTIKREKIKEGDYVYTIAFQGIYHRTGLILDGAEDWDEDAKGQVFGPDQDWRNETLAGSSIVKCRTLSGTTYFSKGIMNEIGHCIKDNPEVNVVFVNAALTTMQIKKLEKRWNDII